MELEDYTLEHLILLDQLELQDTKVNSTECVWVLVSSGMRWGMDLYNSFGWGETRD